MSQQINLFNPALAKRTGRVNAVNMAWSFGAALLLLTAIYVYAAYDVSALEKRVQAATAQLTKERGRLEEVAKAVTAKPKNPELEAEIIAIEARVKSRQEVMDTLKGGAFGNTEGYSEYLRAFARQIVDGLWLTEFSIVGAGTEMALYGKALQPDLVPAYLRRLNDEPAMQGRTFAGIQMRRPAPAAADPKDKTGNPPPVIEFSLFSAGAENAPKM